MLISWGKKVVNVGILKEFCEACQQETKHRVSLVYGVLGLFFIFNIAGDKHYYLRCPKCHTEWEGQPAVVESLLPQGAIPTLDRYGCFLIVGAAVLLVLGITWVAWFFQL
jgi:hypothetical protein